MNNALHPSRRRQAGFTLVEALVAFLVMAFGMLAVAGFQITMSRNSDVAKQRSEAVRLGQQKIESLRTFQQVVSDGTGTIVNFEDDVVAGGPETIDPSSADAYATNATYTRQWWITKNDGVTVADAGDLEKWLRVQVSWTDRAGEGQSVTLRSVISRSDPVDLGTLFTGPNGTKPRTPKNRNINIPYPAVALGGGKTSAFQPPGSSNSYVFDNPTGDVLGYCAFPLAAGATVSLETDTLTTGCVIEKAYIVSGYIQFLNSLPSGTESGRDNAISNSTTATKELSVDIAFVGAAGSVRECSAQRQKVVSVGAVTARTIATASRSGTTVTVQTTGNHGFVDGQVVSINGTTGGLDGSFTITKLSTNSFSYTSSVGTSSTTGTATLVQELTLAESAAAPSGYNSVKSRFVAYICIVRPFDDGDATTADKWSGQVHLTPQPTDSVAWLFGTTTGTYKVCRFTGDYTSDNQMANSEHPLYYRAVTAALDNQNYLVVPADVACPTDDETAPLSDDYINTNAVLHQNASTGVAPYGGAPSQGTQWGGSTNGEPADTSTALPMF